MKLTLKEKVIYFAIAIFFYTFSYSMCSTHELRHPNSIFNTRRNRFCATPLWMLYIGVFLFMFFIL